MTGIDIKKTPPELTKELLDKAIAAIREEQIIKAYDITQYNYMPPGSFFQNQRDGIITGILTPESWTICTNNTLDHHIDFTYQGA